MRVCRVPEVRHKREEEKEKETMSANVEGKAAQEFKMKRPYRGGKISCFSSSAILETIHCWRASQTQVEQKNETKRDMQTKSNVLCQIWARLLLVHIADLINDLLTR